MRTCLTAERKLELLKIYMEYRIDWMATKLEHGNVHNYQLFLQVKNRAFFPIIPLKRYWDSFPSFEQFIVRVLKIEPIIRNKNYCLYSTLISPVLR
jgi:hypothetical protein